MSAVVQKPPRNRPGRVFWVLALAATTLAVPMAGSASADPADTTPPQLTTLTITPSTINTETHAVDVDIAVVGTDDLSGIQIVRAGLLAPNGAQFDTSFFGSPSSGTPTNGTWHLQVTLPQYSPHGTYELTIELVDAQGNTLTRTPAQLAAAGVPNIVVQQGVGDELAPALSAVALSPSSVDTSDADRTVDVAVDATDNLSGVDEITAILTPPGAGAVPLEGQVRGDPDSGTPVNGQWTVPVVVPRGSVVGDYSLSLVLADAVGNELDVSTPQIAQGGFHSTIADVDQTAPIITITNGPAGPTNVTMPTFGFTTEAGATLSCSIDQGTPSFGACSTALTHSPALSLAEGNWTFRVRAQDAYANAAIATRSFSVDTTPPETTIDSGPSGLIASTQAAFTFSSPEVGASFECRLSANGSGPWQPCTSPRSYAGLANGSHLFEVRSIDAAGNLDRSPASRSFDVDAAPPAISILSGPSATTSDSRPTFTFVSDPGATLRCSIDHGSPDYGPCSDVSSHAPAAALAAGLWTFHVEATDAAGNSASASRSFTIVSPSGSGDPPATTMPDTTIVKAPKPKTTKTSAKFVFAGDSAARFECKLDRGSWAPCTSPTKYKKLRKGRHSFEVRAIDASGNADPSPAAVPFKVVAPKRSHRRRS